jgi:hypothetical protein
VLLAFHKLATTYLPKSSITPHYSALIAVTDQCFYIISAARGVSSPSMSSLPAASLSPKGAPSLLPPFLSRQTNITLPAYRTNDVLEQANEAQTRGLSGSYDMLHSVGFVLNIEPSGKEY